MDIKKDNNVSLQSLQAVEDELTKCVNADQRNWSRIYVLMHQVEQQELYKPVYKSFTAWVNHTADVAHCHVSTLWARNKAGRVYAEYEERATAQGRTVPTLQDVTVSPDTLALCEKVAGKRADIMDDLISKAIKGGVTREDLRQAARAKRAAGGLMPRSRYDRLTKKDRVASASASATESVESVTAADIVLGLRSSAWLTPNQDDRKGYLPRKYHVYTEFPIDTGETSHAQRMDALVCETLTTNPYTEKDKVVLRGIEIKVSVSDLVRDKKMKNYTDYCDYFYIAVPDDIKIIDAAESVRLPEWGVLVLKDTMAGKSIKVLHDAHLLSPVFRDKTLSTALIKLL